MMSEIHKKSSKRIRNITIFSIIIMLIFSWIVVDQIFKAARLTRDEALSNDMRLLHIMSQQVEPTFVGVDNALKRAVQHQYYNESYTGNTPEKTLSNMQDLVKETPHLSALIFVDESGTPIMAAHKENYSNWMDYDHYSFNDNILFQQIKYEHNKDLVMAKLRHVRKDGFSFILMGRRVEHPDGSFGGAFIAAINSEFLINYLRMVEQGSQSYISLQLSDNGALLAESPHGNSYDNDLNYLAAAGHKQNPGTGAVVNGYNINGAIEIYGFIRLKTFPVLVTIVLDEADYMKAWQEIRFKDICFLIIFIIFGSLLSFFAIAMAEQIMNVEKSEAAAVLASQAKSEFLATMSHELRTPLNAIIGFSEMMNSGYFGPLNPKQKERINDINLCGSHLLNLITDILEFSKGAAGKLELGEERVPMREIVNESLRIMNSKIKEKHMNMLIEVEENIPDVWGDKRKIRQILLNLLSNSLKFTPDNGTIKVMLQRDDSKNIHMIVSDTGMGIAEKDIPVALSVFGQIHRNQNNEGTGLGLPLCKMFTELHGGRFALGSTVDEGTTVRVTFPASRVLPS